MERTQVETCSRVPGTPMHKWKQHFETSSNGRLLWNVYHNLILVRLGKAVSVALITGPVPPGPASSLFLRQSATQPQRRKPGRRGG